MAAKKTKSPAQGTAEVDTFMTALDHPFKAEVQVIRDIIKGVHPGITEQVKWNAPSFSYNGYLVTFNLWATEHVHLVFHRAAILSNPDGLLLGDYPDRRMMYFTSMDEINAKRAALENIIREWIAIQDQAGENSHD